MTSERWREIERLYESAIALRPAERVQFLAAVADVSLRREVESLLDVQTAAQSFFERPALASRGEHAPVLEAGACIGPYVITGVLGAGGMGEVYKARDQRLEREVALKFLPSHSAKDVSALDRMKREARAASALNHPRMCTLHDLGEHEGRPFLVMELLEGESLKQRLARGPLSATDVISIGAQITDALSAAHAKGFVHSDIKPTNIFVNQHGDVKLLDFGLAKLVTEATPEAGAIACAPAPALDRRTITIPGTACGTAAYMSPEQIRGEPVDARSDLFSVGVTLYEMATGRLPFQGDAPEQLMERITGADSPIPPRSVNSAVPPALEAIILRALQKERPMR
jgi:non-specific serine/threonine protein kinase